MKILAVIMASSLIFSGCATGKNYATRAELQADPGARIDIRSPLPVAEAFALLRDLSFACFEIAHIRVYGEAPGLDGRGGSVTIGTAARIQDARIVATTTLEPAENGGTLATIFTASEPPPTAVLARYRRWLDGGAKTCNE